MTRSIVVGLDGTEQARAAAAWAAEEAVLRGAAVRLVHVLVPSPDALVPFVSREPVESWAEELLTRTAAALRERRPGLPVTTALLPGDAVPGLVTAADDADLLVLGSRALGAVAGYFLGSVGMTVAGLVERPVVLVREGDPPGPLDGPVSVGVDLREPADGLLGFAFDEAARRRGPLHVTYARRSAPPELQRALDDLLLPWRAKYPELSVTARVVPASAGPELVRAAADASLAVIGRRIRRSPLSTHIGSVAHAVLHHSRAPVVLVPHE
ncbi:universal stress protein [Streptomyces sp. SKN60]|uniref:universal stress protein n=1 Tax=Streptomyces sp. SKN60 TaxID=2855506 RepID=UPI0022472B2A|nr:universal stress protein [Streptomyces sp. SKN60]MCX2181422.1 universal stress protein [Streptomyces sp. SKN60]